MLAELIAHHLYEKPMPAAIEYKKILVLGIRFGEVQDNKVLWVPIAAQPLTLYAADPNFLAQLDRNIIIAVLALRDAGDSYATQWFKIKDTNYKWELHK